MFKRSTSSLVYRTLILSATSCAFATPGAMAQRPSFVSGEIALYCQPNTPRARVDALAKKVNAEVTPLLLADAYKLKIPASATLDNDTLNAVSLLKMEADVRNVQVNALRFPTQTTTAIPNDPGYKLQYQHPLMNMPQAWALQKGATGVNIAIVDTGFNPAHEDMAGQYLADSVDITNSTNGVYSPNITAVGPGSGLAHGQFVAGMIFAKTNNNLGVAGIAWQNIKCLAIKSLPAGSTDTSGFSLTDLVNAYTYVYSKKDVDNIRALNLSLGGVGDPKDATGMEYVGLKKLADAGVVVVVAAGNDYETTQSNTGYIPAGFSFVVTVGSVGPKGKRSYYSQINKVDIAAPGGDQSTALTDGVYSTTFAGYDYEQGTSFASPAAAGVLGLIMSVPNVTGARAVQVMEATANRTNITATTLPDPQYGYGLIDAFAALQYVSTTVTISAPNGLDANGNSTDTTNTAPPIETFHPVIKFTTNNIAPGNVTVKVDGGCPAQRNGRCGTTTRNCGRSVCLYNPTQLLTDNFADPYHRRERTTDRYHPRADHRHPTDRYQAEAVAGNGDNG